MSITLNRNDNSLPIQEYVKNSPQIESPFQNISEKFFFSVAPHLTIKEVYNTLRVCRNWKILTEQFLINENLVRKDLARCLIENLNEKSHAKQKKELNDIAQHKISHSLNILKIKSSTQESEEKILNILKDLENSDLKALETLTKKTFEQLKKLKSYNIDLGIDEIYIFSKNIFDLASIYKKIEEANTRIHEAEEFYCEFPDKESIQNISNELNHKFNFDTILKVVNKISPRLKGVFVTNIFILLLQKCHIDKSLTLIKEISNAWITEDIFWKISNELKKIAPEAIDLSSPKEGIKQTSQRKKTNELNKVEDLKPILSKISYDQLRECILKAIVWDKVDKNKLSEVLEIFKIIDDDQLKVKILENIVLNKADENKFNEVIEISKIINNNEFKDIINELVIKHNLSDKAIEIAKKIPDDQLKGNILWDILILLILNDRLDEFQEVKERILSKDDESEFLQKIYLKLFEEDTVENLIKATKFTNIISTERERKLFINKISKRLANKCESDTNIVINCLSNDQLKQNVLNALRQRTDIKQFEKVSNEFSDPQPISIENRQKKNPLSKTLSSPSLEARVRHVTFNPNNELPPKLNRKTTSSSNLKIVSSPNLPKIKKPINLSSSTEEETKPIFPRKTDDSSKVDALKSTPKKNNKLHEKNKKEFLNAYSKWVQIIYENPTNSSMGVSNLKPLIEKYIEVNSSSSIKISSEKRNLILTAFKNKFSDTLGLLMKQLYENNQIQIDLNMRRSILKEFYIKFNEEINIKVIADNFNGELLSEIKKKEKEFDDIKLIKIEKYLTEIAGIIRKNIERK